MAQKGFVAHYHDGTMFSEADGYWLDAPDKGIRELHYVLGDKVEVIKGCDFYFFSNEAIHGPGLSGQPGLWVAAIVGGVKNGEATLKRISADGAVEVLFLPMERLMFSPAVYRKG